MGFADFVCFEAIIPELKAGDRDGAIVELVSALDKAGRLGKGNCDGIIKEVIKREKEASTGMGKGIAVPHVKHHAVKDVVAAIFGDTFNQPDGQSRQAFTSNGACFQAFTEGEVPKVSQTVPDG
jgi:mannitol/fructose-specific phosphotransferase system IIA component (Ntr-type)